MKKIRIILLVEFSMYTAASLAHEGHGHGRLAKEEVIAMAAETKAQFVEEGKLAQSWAKIESSTASLVRREGIQNWVVAFADTNRNERLTLVFSITGAFVSMASAAT